MEEYAVRIKGVQKTYPLYACARDHLKEAFRPFKKRYHTPFHALSDIDINIKKGSTVGIIGRNGSGKSTLLQCICGIVNPTRGSIEVNGKIAALLELGAGFNPEFSGRDNLYMNAAILGLDREQTDAKLDDILAFADIGEYIDQPVRAYSSGMFVRLAFAIAIHVDPEILIVDEALAVGDVHFQAKCFDRFHQFREQGVTVIFVTHDLNMVTRYCDQAYLLNRGKLTGQGNPRQVVADYRKLETGHQPEDQADPLFTTNPYEVRYGNNKATILSGGIYDEQNEPVQTLTTGSTYRIHMAVRFETTITDPVFAFTIKDAKGTEIAGTNTHFTHTPTGKFQPQDEVNINFTQSLPLNAGNYLLSIGCVGLGGGDIEVYDRRHDFIAFQMITPQAAVGITVLDTKIEINSTQQ